MAELKLLYKLCKRAFYPKTAEASGQLGSLSAKYESNGNPSTIANTKGDIGGKSYGTYQLTKNSGHAQKFASQYGGALKGLTVGTTAFDKAWKAEAAKSEMKFAQAQHDYIQQTHYQPAVNAFKSTTGIDVNKAPLGIQNMIWSIGVQHGTGGARNIFSNAGVNKGDSWSTVLNKVYNERMKVTKYFKSSTSSIQQSVKNRFSKELQDALKQI